MRQWMAINNQLRYIFVLIIYLALTHHLKGKIGVLGKVLQGWKYIQKQSTNFEFGEVEWGSWGMNWEEAKEVLGVGKIPIAKKFKLRNFRLREFLCLYSNCMIYVELLVSVCFWLIFRVSGNFQKPPGGLLIATRRHMPLYVF